MTKNEDITGKSLQGFRGMGTENGIQVRLTKEEMLQEVIK